MKVSIGSDHAGFEYKTYIVNVLKKNKIPFTDRGTHNIDSVDYPDFAHPVALDVESGEADLGILVCGSGNGVCITANKHAGIRAALCWTSELAKLARNHNNANVLCVPARYISKKMTGNIVNTFLNSTFDGGRHATRVNKISC